MKTIEQLKIIFSPKDVKLVSKFQQPPLISLGVADEKPERAPPNEIGLKLKISFWGNLQTKVMQTRLKNGNKTGN